MRKTLPFPVIVTFSVLSCAMAQTPPPGFACKYIAQSPEIKRLTGYVRKSVGGDRIILEGDLDLSSSKRFLGPRWIACIDSSGRLLWSARGEEHADVTNSFILTSDGDSIWHAGALKNGLVQFAKFDAKTLRKQTSIQLALESGDTVRPHIWLTSRREDESLPIAVMQAVGDSLHIALVSRDLRLISDKLYTFPTGNARVLATAYIATVADRSGHYLFFHRPLNGGPKTTSGLAIVRLDNSGGIKWANLYGTGSAEADITPYQTADGCILFTIPRSTPKSVGGTFVKVGADGKVNWAVNSEGVSLSRGEYAFGGAPYPFIEPDLFVLGIGTSGPGKVITALFALDYQTGKVERQITCTFPGMITFIHRYADSIYASGLKLGMSIRPGASQAALVRFGFDLNVPVAKAIRTAEPRWPAVLPYRNGQLLCSYSYAEAKTVMVETTDENFESGNPSCFLDKANYSVTTSKFATRPAELGSSPLTGITVSDANTKTSEADLSLVPLELKAVPCYK